jgi:hypothetical protein
MNVEGLEMKVLQGMKQSINKIKLIQFEFGGCNIDTRIFFNISGIILKIITLIYLELHQ